MIPVYEHPETRVGIVIWYDANHSQALVRFVDESGEYFGERWVLRLRDTLHCKEEFAQRFAVGMRHFMRPYVVDRTLFGTAEIVEGDFQK